MSIKFNYVSIQNGITFMDHGFELWKYGVKLA